ncbi:MAG TPA: amino acid permease [Mycobacteriales bacterium]|jgi:APA family basic amino acid/polyamine antiporter|nr:amino acid permease [Mycobacteriales bacterium]
MTTTAVRVIPLGVVAIAGIFFVHGSHFHPFNTGGQSGLDAVTAAATLTLFAFVGLESATVAAGARDPRRTIPRATVIGTLLAAAVFIWLSLPPVFVRSYPCTWLEVRPCVTGAVVTLWRRLVRRLPYTAGLVLDGLGFLLSSRRRAGCRSSPCRPGWPQASA